MRSTAQRERVDKPTGAPRSGWRSLGWKILLAIVLLVLMFIGNPLTWAMAWGALNPIPALLIVWGGLFVAIAGSNLFEGTGAVRWAWPALTAGAYLAFTIPGVLFGPDRMVEALAPVTALTLAAHLVRRDLPRALRDWALVMGLSVYTALGVQAMWLIVNSFGNREGPVVFLIAVLLPPLVFEALLLFLRRVDALRDNLPAHIAGLVLATSVAVVVFSFTFLNEGTQTGWRVIFGIIAGILIGGALLIGLLTRPLISAASGSRSPNPPRGISLGRTLVELSHEPILISLVMYIPLRLLSYFTG